MESLKHIWDWLRDWVPYVLPALSNLILVMLGVIMSLPALAETIEKTPKYRRSLAVVCLLAGSVGFVFDVIQRHSGDQQTRELVGDTKTLVTDTNGLVTSATITMNEIEDLRNQVTAYVTSSEIARKRGDNRLADALEQQANVARRAENLLTRQSLVVAASSIIAQMKSAEDQWKTDYATVQRDYDTNKPERFKQTTLLGQRYSLLLAPIIRDADSVRKQLIDTVPLKLRENFSDLSLGYKYGLSGETITLNQLQGKIGLLTTLVQKISELPPDQ